MALPNSGITGPQLQSAIEQIGQYAQAGMVDAATHGVQMIWGKDESGAAFVELEFDFIVGIGEFDLVSTETNDSAVTTESRATPSIATATVTVTGTETTTRRDVIEDDVVVERTTVRGVATTTGSVSESGSQTANHPSSTDIMVSNGSDTTTEIITYEEIG